MSNASLTGRRQVFAQPPVFAGLPRAMVDGWTRLRHRWAHGGGQAALRMAFVYAWVLALLSDGLASPTPAGAGRTAAVAVPFLAAAGVTLLLGLFLPGKRFDGSTAGRLSAGPAPGTVHGRDDRALLGLLGLGTVAVELAVGWSRGGSEALPTRASGSLSWSVASSPMVQGLSALLGLGFALYLRRWVDQASELMCSARALAVGLALGGAHLLATATLALATLASPPGTMVLLLALLAASALATGVRLAAEEQDSGQPDPACRAAFLRRGAEPASPAPLTRVPAWGPLYLGAFFLYGVAGLALQRVAPVVLAEASGGAIWAGQVVRALAAALTGWQLRLSAGRTFVMLGVGSVGASLSLLQLEPGTWGTGASYALMQAGLGLLDVTMWTEFSSYRLRGLGPRAGLAGLAAITLGLATGTLAAATLQPPLTGLRSAVALGLLGLFLALPLAGAGLAERPVRRPVPAEPATPPLRPGVVERHAAPRSAALPDAVSTGRAEADAVLRSLGLTPREREVALLLVYDQMVLKEIAAALYITRNTLRTHLRHIYEKCGVQGRDELARLLAERLGNPQPSPPVPARGPSARPARAAARGGLPVHTE